MHHFVVRAYCDFDVALSRNIKSEDLIEPLGIDPPHLIMTYTALLSLAILRDDFKRLNRKGLIGLLRKTQTSEGR